MICPGAGCGSDSRLEPAARIVPGGVMELRLEGPRRMRAKIEGARGSWVQFVAATAVVALWFAAGPGRAQDFTAALQQRLVEEAANIEDDIFDLELLALYQFYDQRAFAPLWLDGGSVSAQGKALAGLLTGSDAEGLVPADYDADGIAASLALADDTQRADIEVRLSRALIRYASDLGVGRVVPSEIDEEVMLTPQRPDPGRLLAGAAVAQDIAAYIVELQRPSPEYLRLRQALADFRALAAKGGWSRVAEGPTLKPGMTDPRVLDLRRRLIESGDLSPELAAGETYDPAVETAVKRFQDRHGLEPDGATGRATIAALNVTLEQRIDQMLLNMERRRWMTRDPGETYVFVNMADFELKVVDGPKTVFDTRVVVGTPFQRTPVFSAMMTYVVLNPEWNIPPSIASNEMLPKIRKDPGYLAKNNIVVMSDWSGSARQVDPYSVDWSQVTPHGMRYKLVQTAGPHNALGRIKFMFPNPLNIYLHDTPARELFKKAVRSFSHGCIRVQHPVELGSMLLERHGWTKEKLEEAIATGKRRIVTLSQPIPVHLTYITAWVNKDRSIHFRDDIYGRDKRLAEVLRIPYPAAE